MKNWKNIGRATVKSATGHTFQAESLEEAVSRFPQETVDKLKGNSLGYFYGPEWMKKGSFWYNHYVIGGDSHIFYDELGLVIPAWKIKEVSNLIDRSKAVPKSKILWKHVDEDRDFRRVPVPGIRHSRHWRGTYYRIPRHLQKLRSKEIIESDFDETDLVPERYKEKFRDKSKVLTGWDDIPKFSTKSWKAFRRTQHK